MRGVRKIGRSNRERGSTFVEFTLVILPIFAMFFLTIDLGWILFAYASIQEGVREGVRFAITGQTLAGSAGQDASIRQVVQNYSFGFVKPANAATQVNIQYFRPTDLTPVSGYNSNTGGNVVKVTVSGVSINPFGRLWRSTAAVVLSASSSDVVEPSPATGPPAR